MSLLFPISSVIGLPISRVDFLFDTEANNRNNSVQGERCNGGRFFRIKTKLYDVRTRTSNFEIFVDSVYRTSGVEVAFRNGLNLSVNVYQK